MRRILTIAGLVVAGFAAAIVPNAAASASVHGGPAIATAKPDFPAFALCRRNIGDRCLRLQNDSSTGGTPIFTSDFVSGQLSEEWGVVLVNVTGCGTHVIGHGSGACPFAFGSGLNSGKDGDPIVQIENVNLTCLGFDSSNLSVNKTDCGNNNTYTTVFVQDNGGFGYVSVPKSDDAGAYRYLTSTGTNNQAVPAAFNSTNSQWGTR